MTRPKYENKILRSVIGEPQMPTMEITMIKVDDRAATVDRFFTDIWSFDNEVEQATSISFYTLSQELDP